MTMTSAGSGKRRLAARTPCRRLRQCTTGSKAPTRYGFELVPRADSNCRHTVYERNVTNGTQQTHAGRPVLATERIEYHIDAGTDGQLPHASGVVGAAGVDRMGTALLAQ